MQDQSCRVSSLVSNYHITPAASLHFDLVAVAHAVSKLIKVFGALIQEHNTDSLYNQTHQGPAHLYNHHIQSSQLYSFNREELSIWDISS